jgi:phospholipid-binding lipoprotein MlaA
MFRVNDTLYTYFLKPVAQGYAFVVPDKLRQGIDNAFYNVRFPGRFVNDLLEARFPSAVRETGSFMVNTIFGFLGFIKVSRHVPGLQPPPVAKDTGLTLGTWGLGQGFYIVWPVFGPNTLRSSVGLIGDYFLDPLSYIDPDGWRYGLKGEEKVNMTSLHLGEYEDMKEGAVDPYIALRSAYIQHRKQLLQD